MKKNMNFSFKKFWFSLASIILVLLPGIVFAASNSTGGIQIQSFSIPAGDLSVAFLARVFGTVGGGLVGIGPTIFGQIFYVFNWGILMIAGIFLIYTTGRSIVEIANADAGQMARKFSWWIPLRVALGVSLLVPQATGYSTLNSMVMWVTLQGVGLADAVWSQAVDFLQKGGALYTPIDPVTATSTNTVQQIDKTLVDNLGQDGVAPGKGVGTASILRSQICMNMYYNHLNSSREAAAAQVQSKLDTLNASIKTEYTDQNKTIPANLQAQVTNYKKSLQELTAPLSTFSETCDAAKCADVPGANGNCLKFPCNAPDSNQNGLCGVYTWLPVKPATPPNPGAEQDYADAKKTGLQQVVLGLSQFADDAVNKYKDSDFDAFNASWIKTKNPYDDQSVPSAFRSFSQQAYEVLVTDAGAYQATIYSQRTFAANNYQNADASFSYCPAPCSKNKDGLCVDSSGKSCNSQSAADDMTSRGWIAAGSYYFKLMSVKSAVVGENAYYRFYDDNSNPNHVPPYCSASGSSSQCSVSGAIKNALGNDETSLEKRLTWVGAGGASLASGLGLTATAYELVDDLNTAAASSTSGTFNLPKELQDFVKNKTVHVATGAYVLTDIILNPLSDRIQNVFCRWGLNVGMFKVGSDDTVSTGKCGDFGEGSAVTAIKNAAKMSPIERLQDLGESMIKECIDFWNYVFASLTAMVTTYYAGFIIQAGIAGGLAPFTFLGASVGGVQVAHIITQILQESIKFFVEVPFYAALPIAMAASVLMLTTGVTLAYYIPLLPFMFFVFGAIGWLAFVIEAMVAAPLVALGVTHPEGHDLLGKAEQALMLLLTLFVRPAAMIIGLIAGIVVSYVALDILNTGFGTIIGSIYYSSGGGGAGVENQTSTYSLIKSTVTSVALEQIKNSAMILVYVLISMAIVQQCFSLIHIIPSKIMQWIGFHAEAGMDAQLAEGVKGGLTGAAEKMGGAVGETSRGIKGDLGLVFQPNEGSKKDDGGKDGGQMKGQKPDASASQGGAPGGGGGADAAGGSAGAAGSAGSAAASVPPAA